jgi:hypothetical protein
MSTPPANHEDGDDDSTWTRLKRALWGSLPRRIGSVVVGLLVVLVAVGGIADALNGDSKPSSAATNLPEPGKPESTEPTPKEANCTTGPVEHNMRVTIYGASAEACTSLNREAAQKNGEYWRTVPTGNHVEGSQLVCSMAKGSELIEVRDTGEHLYGNRLCAGLTGEGWTEQEGPGEKAEREQKLHEAQAKEAEQQAEARKVEEERPKHEAAAAKLRGEAAALHKREQHEEALAKDDETEAEHIEAAASHVESEEPSEGGAGKDEEANKIREHANEVREHANTHRSNATNFMDEAEAKDKEAEEERNKE